MTPSTTEQARLALAADLLGKNAHDLGWPDLDTMAAHVVQVLVDGDDTAELADIEAIRSALGRMFDGRDMRDYGWPNASEFAHSLVAAIVLKAPPAEHGR